MGTDRLKSQNILQPYSVISASLKGHFKIEVHDEVYARAHLGIVGINYDFFVGRICFKGGAEYNLNILQVNKLRFNEF